jgi:hypothetical protein
MNSLSLPLPSTQAYMRDNETLFNSGLFRRPDLYSMPRAQYLKSDSETHTQETKVRNISNGSGPTAFGVCMKKL